MAFVDIAHKLEYVRRGSGVRRTADDRGKQEARNGRFTERTTLDIFSMQ